MKQIFKTGIAVILSTLLLLPVFGCTDESGSTSTSSSTNTSSSSGSSSGSSSSSSADYGLVDGVSTATLYNTETRPLTMSIGAIDGNFNPFFYTAANDGTVIALTQASMLSTDESGNIVCGEDYPTVVKDYTLTSYDANGKEVDQATATSGNTSYTEYEFLIKNGMKFSDGEDLTIMDVLFSLYVNIDLAYTGSATLYSNDIQGLNAYREQDPTLTDDSTNSSSSTFNVEGQQRLNNIIDYCNNELTDTSKIDQVLDDIETIKELFLEEVTSDWTTAEDTFNSRDESTFEYTFTETWQYYYLQEGIISIETEKNSNGVTVEQKDANGKYITTLDTNTTYAAEIAEVSADASKIAEYTSQGVDAETAKEYVIRDYCINNVWESYTGGYGSGYTNLSGIKTICTYWETASNAIEKFAGEARTEYFESLIGADGKLSVSTISGVTTERVTSFNGTDLGGETYDVLKIKINGVDPKAIFNFAFTVCPLHYYSGTWGGKDYVAAAEADYEAYVKAWDNGNTDYQLTEFGIQCGNSDFFSDILQDTNKNGLPVGAGPYAASNSSGGTGSKGTFYNSKMVYYVRNDYFYTMGTGIHNAIIKYVIYKEMGDNSIVNALTTGNIDYGTPSATKENKEELNESSDLDASVTYDTSGYGYVGVNPKYVPDVEIRQAIMKAMNTSLPTRSYYSTAYSQTIYRPMSKTSWAYPEGCSEYYSIAYTTNVEEIEALVESAGYWKNSNGIYTNGTTTCKFTFTIAGDTTDHPAYAMFTQAETILEQAGFDITVKTDTNALNKLASGNLEVWAAAWSSAVDPDMYQVYHMDSTASSVKNWNYSEILANPTEWEYEYNIIVKLSGVIDAARETNNKTSRIAYYAQALDYVMDLAVELPTYQRKDNEVFNKTVINKDSLNANYSCYSSLVERIWEIDYN